MNARWTIDLYPASWQREFGTRFRSTLDHQDASIGDTFDLIASAARAHLQPDPAWQSTPEPSAGSFPARPATDIRKGTLWSIALWAHISLYVVVSLILIGVNVLATPDNL
ncbi:MAG TPA: hypothetical protein VD767_06210, partial [Thermomicrobiales bacterium]|nr:hypothetical protein [Thermomicrobiales bacterium]